MKKLLYRTANIIFSVHFSDGGIHEMGGVPKLGAAVLGRTLQAVCAHMEILLYHHMRSIGPAAVFIILLQCLRPAREFDQLF